MATGAADLDCLDVEVEALGTCRVRHRSPSGEVAELPLSEIQRRIMTRLAVGAPDVVPVEQLVEAVWGGEPPPSARPALQNQISRLRTRIAADAVVTAGSGYRLGVATDLATVGAELVTADAALRAGDHLGAHATAETALARWRGPALEDLIDIESMEGERRRLDEVHHSLENLRLDAALGLRHTAWAVPEAERLVAAAPHDERRWVLLMQALDLAGRRGDALGAYERARRSLAAQLGLEPGPLLRAAEAAVLGSGSADLSVGPVALVGRTELVEQALVSAEAGGSLVLVGESGIGKTRALEEIARRLRRSGAVVARSSCSLHPDTAVSILGELADELGVEVDPALPPIAGFVAAVATAAAPGALVVLAVDDLDRAGPTSAAALHAAAARDGVALVATATDVDLLPADVDLGSMLTVPPLQPDEVAALAAALLGDVEIDLAERNPWLATMSGGNPMLLEYLLADPSWVSGSVDPAALPAVLQADLPPSRALRELVRRRVERLGGTTRTALEVAAVCGPRVPRELLTELVPAQGVAGAVGASLLYEDDEEGRPVISFRHGAVRRILYDDLSPGRRMEVHHRAASLLAAGGAAAPSIAVHALAAVEVDPVSAAEAAIAAARAANDEGAHVDAAQWYLGAVAAAELAAGGQHLRVVALVGRGDSLRKAGASDQEQALFVAAEAAFEYGDPTLIGEAAFAVLQLGATTESGSLHGRAIELADRALVAVSDPDQRALIAAAASLTHSMTGASELCRELFLQAEDSARSSPTRRHVLPFAYLAIGHPDDLELRESLSAELLTLALDSDDPVALFEALQLSFSNALQRADGAEVRRVVAELACIVDRVGDVGRRWALAYQQAAVAHLDGDLELAEQRSEEALAVFVGVSPSRAFAAYGAQILAIRLAQGRIVELEESLQGLVDDQPGVPAWHAALALSLAATEPERARRHATVALEGVAPDFTWLAAHVFGGRAAALVGDDALVERYRERLLPYSGLVCWQGTCGYGPVDTVLALLSRATGDLDAARVHLRAATDQVTALAAPVFRAELDELAQGLV